VTDQELSLNGPERFRKRSPRLTLEEHGGCEVPAGCGGVVLRWVRKGEERAGVVVTLLAPASVRAWMDGVELEAGRIELLAGEHVLAAELAPYDQAGPGLVGELRAAGGLGWRHEERSTPDGTWRATATAPLGDGWRAPEFDDRAWTPLVERPEVVPERASSDRRARLRRLGALALGLPLAPAAPRPLWLRKRWTLPPQPPPRRPRGDPE